MWNSWPREAAGLGLTTRWDMAPQLIAEERKFRGCQPYWDSTAAFVYDMPSAWLTRAFGGLMNISAAMSGNKGRMRDERVELNITRKNGFSCNVILISTVFSTIQRRFSLILYYIMQAEIVPDSGFVWLTLLPRYGPEGDRAFQAPLKAAGQCFRHGRPTVKRPHPMWSFQQGCVELMAE